MQKIEVQSNAQSAEDTVGTSKFRTSQYLRLSKRMITAAALAAGLLVQSQGFAQVAITPSASTGADAATTSDPEKAARKTWRAAIRNTPVSGKGCFHVKYPNVAWESVACAKPRAHPARATAGNHFDYVAQATGLISRAAGFFEGASNVTSETSVGGDKGATDGPNEYDLQMNTNSNGRTDACGDYTDCTVWQQFIYATDYNCGGTACGEAALFIQYWLLNWTGNCPKDYLGNNWQLGGKPWPANKGCFKNSRQMATLPDIPVTELGCCVRLIASAEAGHSDGLALEYGDDVHFVSGDDSVLDIASVWTQAEFNVVGDNEYSQAQFNLYSSIPVTLVLTDGSSSVPTCVPPQDYEGTTGETNNLNLGTCQAGVGEPYGSPVSIPTPYIQFTQSLFPRIPPIPICYVCRSEIASQGKVRPNGTASLR
jgi:hypothetical protein